MNALTLAVLCILLAFSTIIKASKSQSIISEQWQLSEKGANIATIEGQEAIRLDSGNLHNQSISFQDGIIEFDMYSSGERAFFYVYFRQQSEQEAEVVYIRTHKSNAPDTIQYAPVFQGRSAWQLYHGDRGTAAANLPKNQWVHVKLKIQGQRLTMWMGNNPKAVMENMPLAKASVPGSIRIRGNIPRQSKADFSAYIRNISIQPTPAKSTDEIPNTYPDGQLTQFRVSPVFTAKKTMTLQLPESITQQNWQAVPVQPNGTLEFLRWRLIPKGVRPWAVAADTQLDSKSTQSCMLNVGFSDTLTLLLNNQAVVFADASYRFSENRQEGLLHDKQLSVMLKLKQGKNHLRAIVADSFGGWGINASLAECKGVTQQLPSTN